QLPDCREVFLAPCRRDIRLHVRRRGSCGTRCRFGLLDWLPLRGGGGSGTRFRLGALADARHLKSTQASFEVILIERITLALQHCPGPWHGRNDLADGRSFYNALYTIGYVISITVGRQRRRGGEDDRDESGQHGTEFLHDFPPKRR